MLDQLKAKLEQANKRLSEVSIYLDIEKSQKRLNQLQEQISQPNFWNDAEKSKPVIQELKNVRAVLDPYFECRKELDETEELVVLIEKEDENSLKELNTSIDKLIKKIGEIEFRALLKESQDINNAILSIHAGAGGTESCDWANMLLRMYTRWVEDKDYSASVIDALPGEEAGIKSAVMIVKGAYSYGYLKSEKGVHRLVRISPFDANRRRHTSFASVDVIPEIEEGLEIEINEADLRIDTFRSSGKGGQHVNVTDSAVRITHIPTSIVVQCQNERSQHKNKVTAMKVLKARLYELKMEERKKELEAEYAKKQKIEWGSQIRSYVFHPYSMVKDHRTDYETSNVQGVMDGELDGLIEAFLKWKATK